MGFSFRKIFRIGGGSRVSLSKRGIGTSFGIPGLRIGVGSGRRARITGGFGPFRFYKSVGPKAQQGGGVGCAGCFGSIVIGIIICGAVIVIMEAPSNHTTEGDAKTSPSKPAPLVNPANFSPTAAASNRAVSLFPQVGIKGSAMNREFVLRHKQRKIDDPAFFNNPEWPVILATECDEFLKTRTK